MVTTHKYVHNMNTFLNRWRKQTVDILVLMEELKNPPENSLDNDKSHAVDATESDKSNDECDQVDQTPLGNVPETSAFMDEPVNAPCNETKEEAKLEEPDQAEKRSEAEDRQQSADQEPKELTTSSLLVKRTTGQF